MQLYDGTRLYVGSGTVTFPFDTWSAERIEVLHGPASVLYGEGAIGGVINVVPKRPTDYFTAEGEVAYGTDNTKRFGVGAGGPVSNQLSTALMPAACSRTAGSTRRATSASSSCRVLLPTSRRAI